MKKSGFILCVIIACMGLIGYAIFQCVYPEAYPAWYWVNPLFFLLNVGLLYLTSVINDEKKISLYQHLVLKIVKLLGALLILIFYFIFVRENIAGMVITIAVFYIVYVIAETKILLELNKKSEKK
jgi:hypothetical protein